MNSIIEAIETPFVLAKAERSRLTRTVLRIIAKDAKCCRLGTDPAGRKNPAKGQPLNRAVRPPQQDPAIERCRRFCSFSAAGVARRREENPARAIRTSPSGESYTGFKGFPHFRAMRAMNDKGDRRRERECRVDRVFLPMASSFNWGGRIVRRRQYGLIDSLRIQ